MDNSDKTIYEFPEYLVAGYKEVLTWLEAEIPVHKEWKEEVKKRRRPGKINLDGTELADLAKQFHVYFPTHYFKARCALFEIVDETRILGWIQDNPTLCIVDVGCGSGAASAAVIETMLNIAQERRLTHQLNLRFIGVDPVKNVRHLYLKTLHRIAESNVVADRIKVTYDFVDGKILDSALQVENLLRRSKEDWNQPSLPHLVLLQLNVVRPLADWATEIAAAYSQIFLSTPIDRLHTVTIGNTNIHKPEYDTAMRLEAMHEQLVSGFKNHEVDLSQFTKSQTYQFLNPDGSFHSSNGVKTHEETFHASVCSITSAAWQKDRDWLDVISPQNIRLAWVRARAGLLRESFVDEIDLRLFEHNIDEKVSRLQRKLIAYAKDIMRHQDHLPYLVPKSADSSRPKSLSRLEEEILSVALIQSLGHKHQQKDHTVNSYAYALAPIEETKSEYLYKWWKQGYQDYLKKSRKAAAEYPEGVVIRTDIKSYYTHIHQRMLAEFTTEEISDSQRVNWLLKNLLDKRLAEEYHKKGHGLAQGGVGSGFFANVYLRDIDTLFGANNPWKAIYFRYADDITVVLPDSNNQEEVIYVLDHVLQMLKLERSLEKTEVVGGKQFSELPDKSEVLDELSRDYNFAMKSIWVSSFVYLRTLNDVETHWWQHLEKIQKKLQSIGIFVTITKFSRKVRKYFEEENASWDAVHELCLPQFETENWADEFIECNQEWYENIERLRQLFQEDILTLLERAGSELTELSKQDNQRLRFAVSHLSELGFTSEIAQQLTKLLKVNPSIIREPAYLLDKIANQNHGDSILDLHDFYFNESGVSLQPNSIYMRAMILRAMRYLSPETILEPFCNPAFDHNSPIEERLIATESLLFLGDYAGICNYREQLETALKRYDSLLPRLARNLALLANKCGIPFEPTLDSDSILHDVCSFEDGVDLFAYYEPEEIREYYTWYSGSDEYDDSYDFGEELTVRSY